jgi:hypothetical protein
MGCVPHTGHSATGKELVVGVADPAFGLAAAPNWNGRANGAIQAERQPALVAALYRDLGLAHSDRP